MIKNIKKHKNIKHIKNINPSWIPNKILLRWSITNLNSDIAKWWKKYIGNNHKNIGNNKNRAIKGVKLNIKANKTNIK